MTSIATRLTMPVRLLLGLVFFVFGLNGFLQFIPLPPLPGPAGSFMGALVATGYFFPVLKVTEIAAGVMLLSNRFVPLALILLAPIVVHIALFHIVLAPTNLAMTVFLVAAESFLGWRYRASFAGVLQSKASPNQDVATPSGQPSMAQA